MSAEREGDLREDGRTVARLRPVRIRRGVLRHAEGSAWIGLGGTQVLCAVTVEDRVPPWLRGRGHGWITAEYGMLPRSVPERVARGRTSGRTFEIQRLIGRSLRAAVDLSLLGDRTWTIDCDVLEADGGTRVASITGGWVALADAVESLLASGKIARSPIRSRVAAVSVGIVGGRRMLDLDHHEDSAAQVDLNVVATSDGRLVEIQGAAEGDPFEESEIRPMLRLSRAGLSRMFRAQERALALPPRTARPLLST
ncbi:MAG: ribonuclease PH [Candidatus Eisenbacteria bacterium]|nr:ribonuclease PH [Candidatus Eisenbacteria bacterium]